MSKHHVFMLIWLSISACGLTLDVYISKLGRRHPFEGSYLSLPRDEGHKLLQRGNATPLARKLRWIRHLLMLSLAGTVVAWFIT